MTWGVQNTEGDAHKQLSYALQDMGLNFMDTAEIYPVPPRSISNAYLLVLMML